MVFSLHQFEACRPDTSGASRWGGLLHFIASVKPPCHVVYYLVAVVSRHYIENIVAYDMGKMARQSALRKGPSWMKTRVIDHCHLLWRFFYRNFYFPCYFQGSLCTPYFDRKVSILSGNDHWVNVFTLNGPCHRDVCPRCYICDDTKKSLSI